MDTKQLIADELGDIRALIKTLKARESELRRRLIDRRPNQSVHGARFVVEVKTSTRRTIKLDALPDHIRRDDAYWNVRQTHTVVTKPPV